MTDEDVYVRYVMPYDNVDWAWDALEGFVAWRRGTGDNVELLHIRANGLRCGNGRRLVYRMLDELKANPPYHSVFGFTRVSNERAREFYAAMGFDLTPVPHVYADGSGIMFSQSYARLLEVRKKHESALRRKARPV